MILSSTFFYFSIHSLILYFGVLKMRYVNGQTKSNIALHKPAFQQNTYTTQSGELDAGRFDASNAVDGLKSDLSGLGGQCTISANNKTTAIWWVNLTRFSNVHYITIYYRTDNVNWDSSNGYRSRFLGFSVYVSNTSLLGGILCFKDNHFTKSTIPAVLNISCPVYGQYVIYYNERLPGVVYPNGYSAYAFAEICEFEVYECDIGYFGYNCTESCGHCLDPTQCSPVDGTCSTGCTAGYFGHLCKTECKSGDYGLKCNETCGHCSNLLYCSHVNGTCLTGCQPGYEGERCQKVCNFGYYGVGCHQECSSFCKTSRDCDHVSGSCKDGCRIGWQGDDCFDANTLSEDHVLRLQVAIMQISRFISSIKKEEDSKNWESEFHGFVAAFCISLVLNGVLIAFIIVKWVRRASPRLSEHQVNKEQKTTDGGTANESCNEISYHELGEINKSETYETCR